MSVIQLECPKTTWDFLSGIHQQYSDLFINLFDCCFASYSILFYSYKYGRYHYMLKLFIAVIIVCFPCTDGIANLIIC